MVTSPGRGFFRPRFQKQELYGLLATEGMKRPAA